MRLKAFTNARNLMEHIRERNKRTNHADVQALAYRLERAKVVRQTLLACGVYV